MPFELLRVFSASSCVPSARPDSEDVSSTSKENSHAFL